MSWINNKNVIITGTSTGMGKDIAKLLVNKHGCKVLGVARSVDKLEALKAELGDNFTYYAMDICKKENWETFASGVAAEFKPDILINNAGMIHPFQNIVDLSDRDVERVINTNYISLVYAARTMIPLLQKSATPGYINICSASALLPVAGESVYSSTKAAALALSECIRQEYQAQGWYVGYVMPGPVKTDLYSAKAADGGKAGDSKVKDKIITQIGIKSETAAKRIVRSIGRKRHRIVMDFVAHLMGIFHALFPGMGIGLTGRLIRVVPLNSFKDIFKDDAEVISKRKQQKREIKKSK